MKKIFSTIMVFAIVSAVTAPAFAGEIPDNNGTWNTGSDVWGKQVSWVDGKIAYGAGKTADFSQVNLVADTTVSMDLSGSGGAGITIGKIIFGDTTISNHGWTLKSDLAKNITLDNTGGVGTPVITVDDLGTGTATISLQIIGAAGLIKSGAGTLTLTDANN
ncbi:MAG: hypothetical protein NT033_05120 [Candidatus Omnitrophica bacterium]|nr:hypothetical protein [Candidatus Omnitrophota bacterium]